MADAAPTELPQAQVSGFYHRRAGDALITALNDGNMQMHMHILVGVSEAETASLMDEHFRPTPPVLTVNAYLVRAGGRTALVDSGGAGMAPNLGHLAAALDAAGIDPNSIDTVLLTHLHRDHVLGLIDEAGTARFPNATIRAHHDDFAFWMDDANAAGKPDPVRNQFAVVARALGPYRDRLEGFTSGPVFPDVAAVPLPGHAPGHSGFMVGGRDPVLIWGDIMHLPEVQTRHPEASLVFDYDGAQAAATRRRTLDWVAQDRLTVAGMHLHFPGFAHVARSGGAFQLVPESWMPGL